MSKRNMQYTNRKNIPKDKCLVCDTIEELEHHRIIKDGPYTLENVAILCKLHHILMHKLMRKNPDKSFGELLCDAREIYEQNYM